MLRRCLTQSAAPCSLLGEVSLRGVQEALFRPPGHEQQPSASCSGRSVEDPTSPTWQRHPRAGLPSSRSSVWASAASAPLQQHRGFAASAAAAPVAAAAAQPLVVHDSTVARLKELQAENVDPIFLRIEVEGGGCSGFQYRFALDKVVNPDDIVIERDGTRVVCDVVSMQFLAGCTVQFEESLMRSAFAVSDNPNSDGGCGCGSSFSAKMK